MLRRRGPLDRAEPENRARRRSRGARAGSCTGTFAVAVRPPPFFPEKQMRVTMRKTLVRSAMLLCAIGATAAAVGQMGCSSAGTGGASTPGDDAVGSVGMQLTLAGGEQLNAVAWILTGPGGASTVVQSGSVAVGNSQSVSFLIGGIPSGGGYTISLSGTTTDHNATCAGSA